MAKAAIYLTIICLAAKALADREVTLQWNHGRYALVDGLVSSDQTLAWGIFKDEITEKGWSYLEIKTFTPFSDALQVSDLIQMQV